MKLIKILILIIVFILILYGGLQIGNKLYNKYNIRNNTINVTIPEGYTYEKVGQTLEKSGLVSQKDFMNQVENWTDNNYWFLKGLPNDKHKLDGFLYPATYSFLKDTPSKTIINKMLRTFEINMETNKNYITKTKLNVRDIMVIASLIEKEAGKDIDRSKISSVIYNRLNINMPLQIDATILYVIGNKAKLYNKDLAVKSPYNTYLNKGLPPSPICNPGTKSINAALHPAKTDYIYYVLNSETNEHVFSKTYVEHNKNVAKYIK